MLHTEELLPKDSTDCYNLIANDLEDQNFFHKLGWSSNEFNNQFSKESHFGLGIFLDNLLQGFIFGDLVSIDKKKEYEILLLYVNKEKRKIGYATSLLKSIQTIPNKNILKKIFLEVASNNKDAINLYEKNKFKKIGVREKYYVFEKNKIDAYLFEKKIND